MSRSLSVFRHELVFNGNSIEQTCKGGYPLNTGLKGVIFSAGYKYMSLLSLPHAGPFNDGLQQSSHEPNP